MQLFLQLLFALKIAPTALFAALITMLVVNSKYDAGMLHK